MFITLIDFEIFAIKFENSFNSFIIYNKFSLQNIIINYNKFIIYKIKLEKTKFGFWTNYLSQLIFVNRPNIIHQNLTTHKKVYILHDTSQMI